MSTVCTGEPSRPVAGLRRDPGEVGRGGSGVRGPANRASGLCYRPSVSSRPPPSVVVAIAAAGLVDLELVFIAVACAPYLASNEAWLRAAVTCIMSLVAAVGVFGFISGALQQKPDVRATAVSWSVPVAAALGAFALLLGLLALLLDARPAAIPLLAFVLAVVMPTATIGAALLRPSAREWFEAGRARERRSRRPAAGR